MCLERISWFGLFENDAYKCLEVVAFEGLLLDGEICFFSCIEKYMREKSKGSLGSYFVKGFFFGFFCFLLWRTYCFQAKV